jgi:RimJ/RimL family protein N-acetyltransferase
MHTLTTTRLTLRQWLPEDLEPFAALNADPTVMEFMPTLLSREQSARFIEGAAADLDRRGFGLWAVEERASDAFVGCVGLSIPSFQAPFTPCVEILWRLAAPCWGRLRHRGGARVPRARLRRARPRGGRLIHRAA